MRRIMMVFVVITISGCVFAQSNNSDNPYRNQRESFVQSGREIYQEFIAQPCSEKNVHDAISQYHTASDDRSKDDILRSIARMNCDTAVSFLKELLLSDTNEEIRCTALLYLGWHRPYQLLPFFLEYVQNDISPKEKIAVASVLAVMEEFEQAIGILDQYCLKLEEMNEKCINSYYMTGCNISSIKYFLHYIDDGYYKSTAAIFLARLGVYDVTFPVFVETITTNETHPYPNDRFGRDNVSRMHVALMGLAMIGSDEAIAIIESQCGNKDHDIAKYAANILRNLKREGGKP